MHKAAAAAQLFPVPVSQQGRHYDRFAVVAFLAKRDNQGNRRTFRYLSEHVTLRDARKAYAKRAKSPSYLYGALVRLETMEAMEVFGDESVEERWLDENQR